jgi:DNA-binding PadR family transcriptional regulator
VASPLLGEFEVLILLGVMRLGDLAYPPAVKDEIERQTRRTVQRGAVYVTLDRLEAKGLLASRLEQDQPVARRRRYYRISARGVRAVRRSLQAVERMRTGLDLVLDPET